MNQNHTIEDYCKKLRLPYVSEHYRGEIENALKAKLSYEDFLYGLLKDQVMEKLDNAVNRAIKLAGFPVIKRLEEFDFAFQPQVDEKKIRELASLHFIQKAQNIVLLGPPGVGKTHLAIALGLRACLERKKVLFLTVQNMVHQLKVAEASGRLIKTIDNWVKIDVLIIDELGYMELDKRAATLFFQLISKRYEKGSIIITSNKQPTEWGQIMDDDVIATAILDRVFHHCHPFIIQGDSYRMKHLKT